MSMHQQTGPLPLSSPLWLLRHARPCIAPGICYGQHNVEADPSHTEEAALAMVQAVLDHRSAQPDVWHASLRLVASPLGRCRQLQEALATRLQPLGIPVTCSCDARLAEIHFGTWENRPWSDITPQEWALWMASFMDFRLGGKGETVRELISRVSELAMAHQRCRIPTIWITHAGVMRATALLWQTGFDPLRGTLTAAQWAGLEAASPGGYRLMVPIVPPNPLMNARE